ncbi:hypothetical protein HY612_00740 [Candidatus Roizmanbacteria bacterium]|nr:hypothetical protein [Candidatus Roizmanbacteria bacterium]
MIFLVVPIVLLFSDISLRTLVTINRLIVTTIIAIIGIFLISFSYNVTGLINRQNSKSINDRIFAKKLILKYSNKNEFIVTDEAALYGMTGRLPPPELADLSLVQIQTQNISKEKFKQIILKYEPKMILAWNGRLNQMKGFEEALFDYKEINYSNGKKVFMLENFY